MKQREETLPSVREVGRQRDTRIDHHAAVLDEPTDHAVAEYHTVVLETTGEPQWQRFPQTRRSEAGPHKQQTTLLKKPRRRGARAPTANQRSRSGADRVVALELPEVNLVPVSDHKVVLEEATQEDREQRQKRSQKSQWRKEVDQRGSARLPKRSTEAKNLHDDEQRIYQKFTQMKKVTKTSQNDKEHSQLQANKEHSQLQAEKEPQFRPAARDILAQLVLRLDVSRL